MSTKIYDGYRLAKGEDPFVFSAALRVRLREAAENTTESMMVAFAVAGLQYRRRYQVPLDKPRSWYDTWCAVDKADRDMEGAFFEFSAVLLSDAVTDRIYSIIYTRSNPFRSVWEGTPGVEYYPYWNNTDQPELFSDDEWQEHFVVWNRLLPGLGTPIEEGLLFQLYAEDKGAPLPLSFLDTTREDRLASIARHRSDNCEFTVEEIAVVLAGAEELA